MTCTLQSLPLYFLYYFHRWTYCLQMFTWWKSFRKEKPCPWWLLPCMVIQINNKNKNTFNSLFSNKMTICISMIKITFIWTSLGLVNWQLTSVPWLVSPVSANVRESPWCQSQQMWENIYKYWKLFPHKISFVCPRSVVLHWVSQVVRWPDTDPTIISHRKLELARFSVIHTKIPFYLKIRKRCSINIVKNWCWCDKYLKVWGGWELVLAEYCGKYLFFSSYHLITVQHRSSVISTYYHFHIKYFILLSLFHCPPSTIITSFTFGDDMNWEKMLKWKHQL